MDLRTLGGLSLEGTRFQRPKPLLLLAYLALEGPTARRRLAELLWMEAASPRRSLNVALSQLRSGAPGAVATDAGRVWCDVPCDAAQLLRAIEERDWLRAVTLYGGPFLQGFEQLAHGIELEEWLFGTREVVAHAVRRAYLALAEEAAAESRFEVAGRWAAQTRALDGTVPAEPDDLARTYGLLLASGNVNIHAMRKEGEALGLRLPGSEEAARRALVARKPASTGVDFGSALPPHTTQLVGRREELAQLTSLLADSDARLVSLVGSGGTGKTRLALQLATDQARAGTWRAVHFVELGTLREAEGLASAIGDHLGLDLPECGDREASLKRLGATLAPGRHLMVLDNFEHLLASGPFLSRFLRACPGLRVVVTTRTRLNLDEERVLLVEGLPCPGPSVHGGPVPQVDNPWACAAVRLFVQRARRARSDFVPDMTDLAAVARICERVGGSPLALEMAAAWVRVLGCAEIADALDRDSELLESGTRDRPERHRSMRTVFEHSWRLLSREHRRGAKALSVFRGGFGRQAAALVAETALAQLASLVDRSLLSWDGAGRYHLHPLVQRFLEEEARRDPDAYEHGRERHARYYLDTLETRRSSTTRRSMRSTEVSSGPARSMGVEIEVDLANVLAAWEWAVSHARHDLLAKAVDPLGWFFLLRGRPQQGLAWIRRLGDVGPETMLAVRKLLWSGEFLKELGRLAEAMECGHAAVRLAQRLGAGSESAHALRLVGLVYLRHDPPDQVRAKRVFRRSLTLYRTLGDRWGEALMLGNLGYEFEDPDAAQAMIDEGLELARQSGETVAKALNLGYLAKLLVYCRGEYASARAAAQESIACHQAIGFDFHLAHTLLTLGDIHVAMGDTDAAERVARRVLALCDAFQGDAEIMVRGGAHALEGHAARFRGDRHRASDRYDRALRLLRNEHRNETTVWAAGMSLDGLAEIALEEGRPTEARAHADEALALLRPFAVRGLLFLPATIEVTVPVRAAGAYVLEGAYDAAETELLGVLRRARERKRIPAVLATLAALADLRRRQGKHADAAELFGMVAEHAASPFRLARRARQAAQGLESRVTPSGGDPLATMLESLLGASRRS